MKYYNERNISVLNFLKSKKHPLVWVLITIIVLLIIILLIGRACNHNNNDGAHAELPEVVVNGNDDGIVETETNAIALSATTGLVFESGKTKQTIPIDNPSENKCVLVILVYLADGTKLYESNHLQPGDKIGEVQISRPLKSGVYKNAILVYRCYKLDDESVPVTQTEIPIEIKSI